LNQRDHDTMKLHKSAIRTCTDRLVSLGGLKFRRSAFRGEEPRVTLLVPTCLGIFSDPIPVDFSVNAVTPFYTAALLTESGQMDPRAKELILFVKRWAKDRGICHVAKGHLSPYTWSLLAIYFMQVGMENEGPMLPALEKFAISSGLLAAGCRPAYMCKAASQTSSANVSANEHSKISIGQLFCEFVRFYSKRFNWRNEAISIRAGQRARPNPSLKRHVILLQGGECAEPTGSEVGPTIEDPFKTGNNLGTCMNALSLARLRDELRRAAELCGRGASLTEVLQPWAPEGDLTQSSSGSTSPGSSPERSSGGSTSGGSSP